MAPAKRFLLVKTSSLGDIIHCFPVLDYLAQNVPEAEIDWIVERPFAELLEAHPLVSKVLTVDTRAWRRRPWAGEVRKQWGAFRELLRHEHYDVAFDLQGNLKSGILLAQVTAQDKVGFGRASVPEWPNLYFTQQKYNPLATQNIRQDYLSVVEQHLPPKITPFVERSVRLRISSKDESRLAGLLTQPTLAKGQHLALICPGSMWRNKRLDLDTLLHFLELWRQEQDVRFLFAWGNDEELAQAESLHRSLPEQSRVLDRLSLPVLQNLMSRVHLVLAMDSLPLHLCGTTTTPSYSIFGPSLASKYKPSGGQHHSYQGTCPYGRQFDKRCPILRRCDTGACIHGIAPQVLFQDFWLWYQALIEKRQKMMSNGQS